MLLDQLSDIPYEVNLVRKPLLPYELKVKITNDDIRQRSNLTDKKTIRFTKKSFFCTMLGFTQSHSGPLGYFERLV